MFESPGTLQPLLIIGWIWLAMIATGFWEAYVEGRNAWDKGKLGWKLQLGAYRLTAYHFYLFYIMYPVLLTLPFVIYGWDSRLFGIILSAFVSGVVLEDLAWYVANPAVKFSELYTPFSDYYPWVKFAGRKIVPLGYVICIGIAMLSWYFLWR